MGTPLSPLRGAPYWWWGLDPHQKCPQSVFAPTCQVGRRYRLPEACWTGCPTGSEHRSEHPLAEHPVEEQLNAAGRACWGTAVRGCRTLLWLAGSQNTETRTAVAGNTHLKCLWELQASSLMTSCFRLAPWLLALVSSEFLCFQSYQSVSRAATEQAVRQCQRWPPLARVRGVNGQQGWDKSKISRTALLKSLIQLWGTAGPARYRLLYYFFFFNWEVCHINFMSNQGFDLSLLWLHWVQSSSMSHEFSSYFLSREYVVFLWDWLSEPLNLPMYIQQSM